MKRKLAPEALYSSLMYHEHRVRRHIHGPRTPDTTSDGDVESPETCWDRAAARMHRLDPNGARARALLEEVRQLVRS